jgi:REP element-mobilizing transposase RayT
MDNHYHIVVETPQGNLLKVMHGLNGGYTGCFNRRHHRSGHLFQGRYKGILVTVIKAVAKASNVTEEKITARGKRDVTARKVALYLVQR